MEKEINKPNYILDEHQRKFTYYLCKAEEEPETANILFYFHGWNGSTNAAAKGERGHGDKRWNVVYLIDNFGLDGKGSWFLGEEGDFFVKNFIDKVVEQIRNELGLKGKIYTYGSSMGGFAAAFHGFRLKASSVVLDIPQLKLLGCNYGRVYHELMNKIFTKK